MCSQYNQGKNISGLYHILLITIFIHHKWRGIRLLSPKDEIIDVSEGIDVNKTGASKEWITCHYWYFLDLAFEFEPSVCNFSHDVFVHGVLWH